MIRQKNLFIFVFFYTILLVVFFYPILFTSNIVGNITGDIFAYYFPLKFHALTNIQTGHVPLWNPYIFSGIPFLANMQSSVFYPLGILFYIIPFINAFAVFFFIHYFLAGAGMFLLIKDWRRNSASAFMGAVVFSFSAFLVLKVSQGHIVHAAGYCVTPFVILFMRKLMQTNNSMLMISMFAISLAMQFLSGHIQPLCITLLFVIVYMAYNYKKFSVCWLLSLGLFFLLVAVQFIPTGEYAVHSSRTLWNFELASSYSLSLKNFITLLFPFWFGNPLTSTFINQEYPSVFFENYSLYIGIIPLVLAIIGLYIHMRKRKTFFLGLLFLAVLLSLGSNTPVYYFLYTYVPGFSLLRAPARYYFLILFIMSLLAGDGMSANIFSRYRRSIYAILIAAAFLSLYIPYKNYIYTQNQDEYIGRTSLSRFIDNSIGNYRITTDDAINNPNKAMLYHQFNTAGYEAIYLKDYVNYINASQKAPSVSSTRIHIRNYESPMLKALSQSIFITDRRINSSTPVYQDSFVYVYPVKHVPERYFFAKREIGLSNKEKIIDYMLGNDYNPAGDILLNRSHNYIALHEHDNTIYNSRVLSDKIILNVVVKKPSWMIVSDSYIPGWEAYANGRKLSLEQCNYMMKGIWVDSIGEHTIVCLYRPLSYYIGLLLTLCCLIFLIIIAQINIIKG